MDNTNITPTISATASVITINGQEIPYESAAGEYIAAYIQSGDPLAIARALEMAASQDETIEAAYGDLIFGMRDMCKRRFTGPDLAIYETENFTQDWEDRVLAIKG